MKANFLIICAVVIAAFARALQQLDVVEQESAAIGERDLARRAARGQVRGLSQDPRITQYAPADEHAAQKHDTRDDRRGHDRKDQLLVGQVHAAGSVVGHGHRS